MMRSLTILFLFFFNSVAIATDPLKIYDGKAYQDLKVKPYREFKLSESCLKKSPPECDAYKATQKAPDSQKMSALPMGEHPAALFCLNSGGANRIAKGPKNEHYDYCLFPDGSMIDSWGLYRKFHPTPEKK